MAVTEVGLKEAATLSGADGMMTVAPPSVVLPWPSGGGSLLRRWAPHWHGVS